jgi:hypothetical protein
MPTATRGGPSTATIPQPRRDVPHPHSFNPQGRGFLPIPLLSHGLPAALRALTHLELSFCDDADVSGLTGLRRLEVWPEERVEGLSALTALEELRLVGLCGPLAQPSDLAPLSALTRLAMTCVPPDLGSHPAAARLRRLELQSFGVLLDAPGGGGGSGANGAAAAALAALARGAPLLERLCIRADHRGALDEPFLLLDYPGDVELGAPLGPSVAWPSLAHLHVTPWAALLLAACAFPRLSRLALSIGEAGGDGDIASNVRLRAAVAALAAKAQDQASLFVDDRDTSAPAIRVLAAAAAVPALRHLSWGRSWRTCGAAAAPPGDWARLATSLESLDMAGPLAAFDYAEPLAALTCLTRLFLAVAPPQLPLAAGGASKRGEPPIGPVGSAAARAAQALARVPRLAHLRLTFHESPGDNLDWFSPAVAAELARCPALRLLEIDRRDGPLWRHERGSRDGPGPLVPLPSPAWPPFVQALRAGGFGATVRPAPQYYPLGLGFEAYFPERQ